MKNMAQTTRFAFPLFFFSLTAILLISCRKENGNTCDLIPAKILRVDCDRIIFQLETSEMIGDNTWTNIDDNTTYDNVVMYRNTCKIAEKTNGYANMVLYVDPEKITSPENPANCIECQAISRNPPLQWVDFKTISDQACKFMQN